jgi:hypothetical protein
MASRLYTVESVFTIEGRGPVLVGFAGDQYGLFRIGDDVDLRRPDGSVIRARIVGIEYPPSVLFVGGPPPGPKYGVVVAPPITQADVPLGTEVWATK